ncbi:hypothetical protein MMC21_004858 [Puttea exsequens]|nr:hypothetical protein [Puttea exsequens]
MKIDLNGNPSRTATPGPAAQRVLDMFGNLAIPRTELLIRFIIIPPTPAYAAELSILRSSKAFKEEADELMYAKATFVYGIENLHKLGPSCLSDTLMLPPQAARMRNI